MNHVLFLSMVSKIPHFGALELKLELVRNQGDELRIGGLALGVADGVAEEALSFPNGHGKSISFDFHGIQALPD